MGRLGHKLGTHASATGRRFFENVRVPRENIISRVGQGPLGRTRNAQSAPRLGAAAGADQDRPGTTNYASPTPRAQQFGEANETVPSGPVQSSPIWKPTTNQQPTRILSAEACANQPINIILDAANYSSMARGLCSDAAMATAVEAVQGLGGTGYVKEYPVERVDPSTKITPVQRQQFQRLVIRAYPLIEPLPPPDPLGRAPRPARPKAANHCGAWASPPLIALSVGLVVLVLGQGFGSIGVVARARGRRARGDHGGRADGPRRVRRGTARRLARTGSETEFEEMVRSPRALTRDGLAVAPEEGEFMELDPLDDGDRGAGARRAGRPAGSPAQRTRPRGRRDLRRRPASWRLRPLSGRHRRTGTVAGPDRDIPRHPAPRLRPRSGHPARPGDRGRTSSPTTSASTSWATPPPLEPGAGAHPEPLCPETATPPPPPIPPPPSSGSLQDPTPPPPPPHPPSSPRGHARLTTHNPTPTPSHPPPTHTHNQKTPTRPPPPPPPIPPSTPPTPPPLPPPSRLIARLESQIGPMPSVPPRPRPRGASGTHLHPSPPPPPPARPTTKESPTCLKP